MENEEMPWEAYWLSEIKIHANIRWARTKLQESDSGSGGKIANFNSAHRMEKFKAWLFCESSAEAPLVDPDPSVPSNDS